MPLLLLIFLLPGYTAQLTGTVTNTHGQPLASATVRLLQPDSDQMMAATTTDAAGAFALEAPLGRYILEVRRLGYRTARVETDGSTRHFEIVLEQAMLYGGEVEAVAGRAQAGLTPMTHTNITARDLETLPAMKDIPAQLARTVSITHYSENGNDLGYTYLRLRGFGQRRVAVAINGIPQNDPEEHNVFWINFYDLQGAIRDIQIQRGAGASFYGSTGIGGAINIVTDPFRPNLEAAGEVGYGTYNTQRYTAQINTGLLGGRYVGFARASRLLSDGYRNWSWSEYWRYFAGIRRYGNRHTLTLQSYGGPQYDGLAYVGIPKAANNASVTDEFGTVINRRYNFSAFTADVERFHQPHVELLHDGSISDNVRLQQALFWIKGIGEFDFGGTFRSADYLRLPESWRDLDTAARQLPLFVAAPDAAVLFRAALDQWQIGWLPRVTLTRGTRETAFGLEGRLHRSLRWGRVEESAQLPASVVGPESDYRVYSVRGEKLVTSVYGSHRMHLRPDLVAQGEVQMTWRRYRIFEERFFGNAFDVDYLFVNPRIGLTFHPNAPVSGYISVSLANREPRMKSLYDGEEAGAGFAPQFELNAAGDYDYDRPIVRPERLVDVELGGQVRQPRWHAAANLYWMDFRDEIVPSGGLDQFGVPRTGNADHTRHFGLEAEAAGTLATGLEAYANATISRSRFVRFVEYVTAADFSIRPAERAGNPIGGFPARSGNLGLSYTWRGLTLRSHAKYVGTQYIDNSGGKDAAGQPVDDLTVDPYVLLSVQLQGSWQGLRLSLDVNNLLNDRVLLYGNAGFGAPQFFPAATRHIFLSLRYQWR
ncbi:MAG: TonB-dependent receptor [Bacteroidota bacterium]|nr:TonB-dependent receptor [Bacteroidota bacterium]